MPTFPSLPGAPALARCAFASVVFALVAIAQGAPLHAQDAALPRVAPPLRVDSVFTLGELAAVIPAGMRHPRDHAPLDGTRYAFLDAERGQALSLTQRTHEDNLRLYAWDVSGDSTDRRFVGPDAPQISDDPPRWEASSDGQVVAVAPAPGRLAIGKAETIDRIDLDALGAIAPGPAWEVQADRSLHRSLADALARRAELLPQQRRMVPPEALTPLLRAAAARAGVEDRSPVSGYAVAPGPNGESVEAGYAILATSSRSADGLGRVVVNSYELGPERSAEVARLTTGEPAWGFERFEVRGWPARRVAQDPPPLPDLVQEEDGTRVLTPPPPMPMPARPGSFSTTEVFVGDGVRVVVEALSAAVGQRLLDALDLDAFAAVPARTLLVAPPIGPVPASDRAFDGVAPLGDGVAAVRGAAAVQFSLPDGLFAASAASAGCPDASDALAVLTDAPYDPCLGPPDGRWVLLHDAGPETDLSDAAPPVRDPKLRLVVVGGRRLIVLASTPADADVVADALRPLDL